MKKNTHHTLFALLAALIFCISLAACGQPGASTSTPPAQDTQPAQSVSPADSQSPEKLLDESITFNIGYSSAADSAMGKAMQAACDTITQRTNGEIQFKTFPNSQLGSTTEILEQMRAGAPVICNLGFDNMGDYVTKMQIASAPYVFNDTYEVQVLGASDWMKGVEEDMREAGFAPLGYGSLGYRHFLSTKPIENASSIKGMLVRMGNSSLAQNFITVMGGSPTTSSWNDNYSNLSQGIYDACEASAELLYNSSLHEVAKYLTLSGHFVTPSVFTMNTTYWDKLPETYQQIIREEITKALAVTLDEMIASEADFIQKFKDAGVTVIETDKASFAAYVPELLTQLGLDASEYESIRAAIEAGQK